MNISYRKVCLFGQPIASNWPYIESHNTTKPMRTEIPIVHKLTGIQSRNNQINVCREMKLWSLNSFPPIDQKNKQMANSKIARPRTKKIIKILYCTHNTYIYGYLFYLYATISLLLLICCLFHRTLWCARCLRINYHFPFSKPDTKSIQALCFNALKFMYLN